MIRTFGLKEAKEAAKFARTSEQKLTVLATMAMLGIKNTLKAKGQKAKLEHGSKALKINRRIAKLRKKEFDLAENEKTLLKELRDADDTLTTWSV